MYTGISYLCPCVWQNCLDSEWQLLFSVMTGKQFKICLKLPITGFPWFPVSDWSCLAVLTLQNVSRQRAKIMRMHKQLSGSLTHFLEIWKEGCGLTLNSGDLTDSHLSVTNPVHEPGQEVSLLCFTSYYVCSVDKQTWLLNLHWIPFSNMTTHSQRTCKLVVKLEWKCHPYTYQPNSEERCSLNGFTKWHDKSSQTIERGRF